MSMTTKPLEELIQTLPPDLRIEVRDFVEDLMARRARAEQRQPRQDWAEALKGENQSCTSVDLQHHALDWREE